MNWDSTGVVDTAARMSKLASEPQRQRHNLLEPVGVTTLRPAKRHLQRSALGKE